MVMSVSTSASARSSRAATAGPAVAHRPPHVRGLAGHERGLDSGASVGDGAPRDEPGGQMHVGLLARYVDGGAGGACLGHGQRERCAARPEHERRAPLEIQRERAGSGHERELARAFGHERYRPAGRGGGDQGGARQQAHAIDAVAERFAPTLNAPRAVSLSTRTVKSAAASTAGSGGAGGCGVRDERSMSRLYSASVSVTPRGVSVGRGGCCAPAAGTSASTASRANDADLEAVMSHHPVARTSHQHERSTSQVDDERST